MDSKAMASESLPAAHSPKAKGDDEVLSQRTFPGQGEIQEAVRVAPEDETSAARHKGGKFPWKLAMGTLPSAAPSTIPSKKPVRLRIQASSLLRKKEVRLFRR